MTSTLSCWNKRNTLNNFIPRTCTIMILFQVEVEIMAAIKQEKEVPAPTVPATPNTAVATVEHKDVSDLFRRSINSKGPAITLNLKRVLTRPLVSMSKRKQLAVRVQSEIYLMDLPLTGRTGGMGATRVFDAVELVQGEHGFQEGDEVIVTCHEIMCSALHRAGFASKSAKTDDKGVTTYADLAGKPLKGTMLGFISGDIADGKRYRSISVAELE